MAGVDIELARVPNTQSSRRFGDSNVHRWDAMVLIHLLTAMVQWICHFRTNELHEENWLTPRSYLLSCNPSPEPLVAGR
jgi:hypothetical protein